MMLKWLSALRFVFSRGKQDVLDEELRFHLDLSIERNMAGG